MRLFVRVLIITGAVLLTAIIIVAGAATWFVRRPWPQVKGTIAVSGLLQPVEVIRDRWGVPHIHAQNEHDLFFAQGYVHAQDRLWQMEFNRRIGSGTLSAALGKATLGADRFLRTLGLRRAAEKDWAIADDETRSILGAYSAGVNAYIETHRGRLPLEFTILGIDPAPWTPIDTLSWGKVMSLDLGSNYVFELLRARIIAKLGEKAAQELLPPYAGGAPVIVPPEVGRYGWLRDVKSDRSDALAAILGNPGPDWGSNNWVVHGSRTATGKPMLANDTHLGLNMPSIWYENGLHGGRFDSVGFTFPGVPMVTIGHNSRIGWGVTNMAPDVQDLYIEKLNTLSQPTKYEFMGKWYDLEVVRETIEVKDGEPTTLEVRITRHGPIVSDVIGNLEAAQPMSLRWTALDGSYIFKSIVLLNLATSWDEFRKAISFWDVPGQNFVYADVEGNIGYQASGVIPIRPKGHQGLVPVPGWTGQYEWRGFIPFEKLPYAFNPPTGFIVTANNKVVSDSYPYHIAYEWASPYRAQRIIDLLSADDRIAIKEMRDIQAQTYSLPAQALRPYLLAVEPEDDLQKRALAQVASWDLYNEADRAGASIYQAWLWFLIQNTLGDELGGGLMGEYLGYSSIHMPLVIELMSRPDSPWFDDITTPRVERRDDIVRRSLSDAVSWLVERYKDEPQRWKWGRLHTMTFIHQPLGRSGIGLLERFFNSEPIPARGDNFTVDAASFSFIDPFTMNHGASERLIVDLSNLDSSLSVHTTGQSGHLFHPHRGDFISMWQEVKHHPMLFSRESVKAKAEAALTLRPE